MNHIIDIYEGMLFQITLYKLYFMSSLILPSPPAEYMLVIILKGSHLYVHSFSKTRNVNSCHKKEMYTEYSARVVNYPKRNFKAK